METKVIQTTEELITFLGLLQTSFGIIALDVETEPFQKDNPLKSHAWQLGLLGVGLYSTAGHAYIPADILATEKSGDAFQKLLDTKVFAMHNCKFDLTVLEASEFDVSKTQIHDTLIMTSLVDENILSMKLKDLAVNVLKVPADQIVKYKDIEGEPEDPAEYVTWQQKMASYCVSDCWYTHRLYELLMAALIKDELLEFYNTVERPFTSILRAMERRGIQVDTTYLETMGKKLDGEIYAAERAIYSEAGEEFNLNSTPQLRRLLYEGKKLKIPREFKTKKGEPSTDVEALTYLAKEQNCKLAELILKYRKLSKVNSTYVRGILDEAVPNDDGTKTIHTSYLQHKVKTGRLSSAAPNLQNVPREAGELNIREAFKARTGFKLIAADYSQVELRILAALSGSPAMIKNYEDGGDLYQTVADQIGSTRQNAKAVVLGVNYGLTHFGLSRNIGITEEAAEELISGYLNKFPEITAFSARCVEEMQKTGQVRDIFGRLRRFPTYSYALRVGDDAEVSHNERQAGNFAIQGAAANILKVAMIRIHEALKPLGGHMLLQVHDEVVCEVPEGRTEEACVIIKTCMEEACDLKTVRLMTIPAVSDRWRK